MQLKSKNTSAFGCADYRTVFDTLYIPLCQYSYRYLLSSDAAEDIVQDTFVYLWQNWKRLSKIDSLKSYLYTTVKNRSIKFLQSKYAKTTDSLSEAVADNWVDADQPNAEELLEYDDLQRIVERALEQLPERCRIIFVLKRFDGMKNKEIAEFLNISVKTVEAQMTIAIKKLTTYVSVQWGTGALILLNIWLRTGLK